MPSVIFNLKEMARVAYSQNENVKLIDETTNDEPWGPTCQQMDEVCRQYQYGGVTSEELLAEIVHRLENRNSSWRRCYKSLLLLDHMARTLPERCLRDLQRVVPLVSTISNTFYHTDSKGVDQGLNVRERSKKLLALLQDRELLAAERQKNAVTAAKVCGISGDTAGPSPSRFGGISSSSVAGGGGSSSFGSGTIAGRTSVYGGGGGYDSYSGSSTNSTPFPRSTNGTATNTAPPGRPLSKEEQEIADMEFAARLQREEEARAGTRVLDTDIGRRIALEGQKEREERERAEWQRRQAELMGGGGRRGNNTAAPSANANNNSNNNNSLLDAEARMAMELQARLDRGEDMESAIAALTAKYTNSQQQQQVEIGSVNNNNINNNYNSNGNNNVARAQQQQQQQQAAVIDPFAMAAPTSPPAANANNNNTKKPADIDFFSDIPQGNFGSPHTHQHQQQQQEQQRPAALSTLDDLFGGPSTTAAPQRPLQPNVNNANTSSSLDFFGGAAQAQPNPTAAAAAARPYPATAYPSTTAQHGGGSLDFFGNVSPNGNNNTSGGNNAGTNSAVDFFGNPIPSSQKASSASPNEASNALSQAQQNSIDALTGQAKRQAMLGGGGGGGGAGKAPVW